MGKMTKRKIKYFLVLLVVAILLAVPVLAYSNIEYRASEQLTSYSMNAKATGNGKIAISFSVDGTGKMTRIGAKKIIVYQQIGGTWALANSLNQDDAGMISTNSYYHGNTIYYNGISGEKYRIEITIFAEDASGSDSRTQTFYVTA
jgi:hypothetical protein